MTFTPGQLNLFNEAEAEQDPELPEEDCSQESRPRKKKATHAELFKGLKVHKEVIPLNEEDKDLSGMRYPDGTYRRRIRPQGTRFYSCQM